MPWREVSKMDERREFVRLAMQEGANRRELFGMGSAFILTPDTGGLAAGWPGKNLRTVRGARIEFDADRGCDRGAGAGGARRSSGLGQAIR